MAIQSGSSIRKLIVASFFAMAVSKSIATPHLQRDPQVEISTYPVGTTEAAINSNDLFVNDSWKNEISRYQLDNDGTWSKAETIPADSITNYSHQKLDSGGNKILVPSISPEDTPQGGFDVFENINSTWRFVQSIGVENFWFNSALGIDGTMLVVAANETLYRNDGPPQNQLAISIYEFSNGNFQLSEQVSNTVPQDASWNSASDTIHCISAERIMVADLILSKRDQTWEISDSLQRNVLAANQNCTRYVWLDDENYHITGLIDGRNQIIKSAPPDGNYQQQAKLTDDYLVIQTALDLEVYENRETDWENIGYIALDKPWRRPTIQIQGSLLVTNSDNTGTVKIIDLTQATLNQAPSNPTTVCSSGSSDPDEDGYGWENETACVVPAQYLLASDPIVSSFLQTDMQYPQLPGQPLTIFEDTAVLFDNPLLLFYTNTGTSWELKNTIDVIADYLPLKSEDNSWPNNFSRVTATISDRDLIVGFPSDSAFADNLGYYEVDTGNVVTYYKEGNDWQLQGLLQRPEEVRQWEQFGNALNLEGDTLVVNSSNSGGYGGSRSGLHTFKRNADNTWTLADQLWDKRRGSAGGKMGSSFDTTGSTLITSSFSVATQSPLIEIYERDISGTLNPQHVIPLGNSYFRHQQVLVDGDRAAVGIDSVLHILKKDSDRWRKQVSITGGHYVVAANNIWKVDPPLGNDETSYINNPWKDGRSLYPVALLDSQAVSSEDSSSNDGNLTNSAQNTAVNDQTDGSASSTQNQNTEPTTGGGKLSLGLLLLLWIIFWFYQMPTHYSRYN